MVGVHVQRTTEQAGVKPTTNESQCAGQISQWPEQTQLADCLG